MSPPWHSTVIITPGYPAVARGTPAGLGLDQTLLANRIAAVAQLVNSRTLQAYHLCALSDAIQKLLKVGVSHNMGRLTEQDTAGMQSDPSTAEACSPVGCTTVPEKVEKNNHWVLGGWWKTESDVPVRNTKLRSVRVSDSATSTHTPPLYNADVDTSGVDERKLIRKLDMALIPWLSFLYLLSFLDRTSIGNAKLYNLEGDLHMTDNQYLISLTVFFFSYAIFEVPSNVFLKRLRPSIWLSLLMLLWGIMMTIQGLVHDYPGLAGMRTLLGACEAGLFPGVNYYLSCWYKRSEFGIRAAIFFSAATVSGAFGGLLAAAISNMEGIGGKHAWAWIFILEGLVTVLAGAASFWIIQDFPDTATFLTEAERTFVIRRLQSDDQFSAAGEKLKMKYIWKSLLDWKTWVGMIIYMGADMPLYAFSLFLPSIINQLGEYRFKATPANLLTVPVYTAAGIMTCLVGFFADRYGHRGYFNLGCLCIGAAGYIILVASRNAALSYFAVYMAACGIYPVIPNTMYVDRGHYSIGVDFIVLFSAWVSNNVEGSYKRSVSLAMVISFGNINGAVSSNVYRSKDKPWYPLGHGLVLMYISFGIIATISYHFALRRENARRDRGERDEVIGKSGDSDFDAQNEKNGRFDNVADAKREKGDEWSGYRYIL
ncbi:MFS general substrate transporter [Mycena metata]|uniref:MFS general substrate transporter n=1 Tax=Mycena metata TaxID=1033252 RepID=A0AAD7JAR0_9AGAR|nr:MFS general substrate transporter [Mycena metata]